MARFRACERNHLDAAYALVAFLRPDEQDPDAELVGALMVADLWHRLRSL